jgi:hypothetical protein
MTVEVLAGPDGRLPGDIKSVAGPKPFPETFLAAVDADPLAAAAPLRSGGDAVDGAAAQIRVRALENGVIQVTLPPNREIAGAEARVAGVAVRALAAGRRVPVVLVICGVVGVSIEARQAYVSSIAASAFAVVGETPVDRVIAHYLLRSKTETIPAQFFTSETEAVEWLGQYAGEH